MITLPKINAWEIDCSGLTQVLQQVHLLDVRNEDEFIGPLSHIKNSQLIPITELPMRLAEVPQDKPIITVCRSGKRSLLVIDLLKNAGHEQVLSLAGGMIAWNAAELPTAANLNLGTSENEN